MLFVSKYANVLRHVIQWGVALAYPNLYGITYSYGGFAQSQPAVSAFPGTQLDSDLEGLSASIDNISGFMQSVIRSDGALNNGIVTYDSLATSLQSNGLAGANAWLTGVNYTVGAAVYANASLYRCLVSHTSGVFATDLAAGKWLLLTTLPQPLGSVIGPGLSVTGNVPKFHDTTGAVLDDSGVPLASLAPLASPALTGTPSAPTAAVDTSSAQIATTAMVIAQASGVAPLMNGVAAVGVSTRFARADHAHPADTSRHAAFVTPANPVATGGTVMMGLGSACTITPIYGSRLLVTFSFSAANGTATGSVISQVKYGTGAAPANNVAATGTSIGTSKAFESINANAPGAVSQTVLVTGLVPGTAYWFDILLQAGGGSASITNVDFSALEV